MSIIVQAVAIVLKLETDYYDYSEKCGGTHKSLVIGRSHA
jgi:hypothetical protein